MKKGEIYFADLNPTVSSEIKKNRPVLIVSNDANNRYSSLITVIPLTSQVDKVYPFEVMLRTNDSGLPKASKAQCNQIRTISRQRITSSRTAGKISPELLFKIQSAIKLHLDMD